MDCLIGHRGFVGGVLQQQHGFDVAYGRANIANIGDRPYDLTVCTAAPGSMFEANRHPERDTENLGKLIANLDKVRTETMVLISTIAVLKDFRAMDESTDSFETQIPYGVNRRTLESYVADHFPNHLIVRLPALFGEGLKKNFLFDLMNPLPSMLDDPGLSVLLGVIDRALWDDLEYIYTLDEDVGLFVVDRDKLAQLPSRVALEQQISAAGLSAIRFTHPDSEFQFYNLNNLWRDINRALAADIKVLHVAPPPLKAGDIFAQMRHSQMPSTLARVHIEDVRTCHADLWGAKGPFIRSQSENMADIKQFLKSSMQ